MTPTTSGRNYSIQSNGSGPGHSSQKSKRQECQPRGEEQMEDSRTSNSAQSNRDIPGSVQELVYGSKATGVGTLSKSLDRHNELKSSSEEVHRHGKYRVPSGGWTPMSYKGQVQQIKAWLKKKRILSEDQEKKLAQGKDNSPVEAPQASTSSKKDKQYPKSNKKCKKNAKGKKNLNVKGLTRRLTELQRKKIQPWKMCSIWQEL
ncbi:hypothetical protein O181_015451 [Austropuccinia psidii MF-1]|uniref:Uncharacterized protein n=1 Tax=Austropuccinia psidii MF-1 TaxID=1389203 RepID=A0A9Q3GQ47_9BASI|nr:hypothetical protein [Austropuccinia psidii MF-1]